MKFRYAILIIFAAGVTSSHAGISRSKHDNTKISKFERKTVSGGKGIARAEELEESESKFERKFVSRWSDEKRARIAKERAAKAKAARSGKKGCRT